MRGLVRAAPASSRRWHPASSQRGDSELLHENGRHDDGALDDELVLLLQVVDDEQVRDALEDDDAEQRADDGAAAAGQRRAADDGGGDRVELVEVTVVGRPGAGQRDHDDGADAAAQSGQRVEQDRVPADVDAGEAGRLGVAADGERTPAEGGAVEQDPAQHAHGEHDEHQRRDAEHLVEGQFVDEAFDESTRWVSLPEIIWARPRAATSIARVAMNGTNRPYAMRKPLIDPATIPTTSAVKIMPPEPNSWVATVVHQTLVSATSAPTERSMPPPIITKVMPTVITPMAEAWVRISSSLFHNQFQVQEQVRPGDRAHGEDRDQHADQAEIALDRLAGLSAPPCGSARRRSRSARLGRDHVDSLMPFASALAHDPAPSITAPSSSDPAMIMSSTACSSSSVAGPVWMIRPSRITSTRSARPSTSGTSLETSSDPDAVVGEPPDDLVELGPGADVDAPGRFVEQQQPGARRAASAPPRPSAGCRRTACGPAGRRRAGAAPRSAAIRRRRSRSARGRGEARLRRTGRTSASVMLR